MGGASVTGLLVCLVWIVVSIPVAMLWGRFVSVGDGPWGTRR